MLGRSAGALPACSRLRHRQLEDKGAARCSADSQVLPGCRDHLQAKTACERAAQSV